jgi:hypothetical protein
MSQPARPTESASTAPPASQRICWRSSASAARRSWLTEIATMASWVTMMTTAPPAISMPVHSSRLSLLAAAAVAQPAVIQTGAANSAARAHRFLGTRRGRGNSNANVRQAAQAVM